MQSCIRSPITSSQSPSSVRDVHIITIRPLAETCFHCCRSLLVLINMSDHKMDDFVRTKKFFILQPSPTDVNKPASGPKSVQTT